MTADGSARAADRLRPGIIFDVDGVLIASPHELAWRTSLDALMRGPWSGLARRIGYRPGSLTTAIYQAAVAGRPRLRGAAAALERLGVPEPEARAPEYADAKQEALLTLVDRGELLPFDDALALVLALLRGGYAIAAASSSRNATALMARIDLAAFAARSADGGPAMAVPSTLRDAFAVDVCGRDAGPGKPDPGLFLLAARDLRRPAAECVVIEDAPSGIRAAKAAGMRALGVARLVDEAVLRAAGADRVVVRLDAEALLPWFG